MRPILDPAKATWWAELATRAEARLGRFSRWQFALLGALLALLGSVAFHAPKFWILRAEQPGSFEWSRGTTFRQQAIDPAAPAAEPAMRWRALPAWVAHYAGLRGSSAFVLPWLGLVVWLALVASLLDRAKANRVSILATLSILATTGSALAATNWLGVNDGWYLSGLSVVVLSPSRTAIGVVCLLCPWVDERFLMALPLAFLARHQLREAGSIVTASSLRGELIAAAGACGVYIAVRLAAGFLVHRGAATETGFLASVLATLPQSSAFAGLGWFMGWRFGWIVMCVALLALPPGKPTLLMAAGAALTLGSQLLVASDHSRTCIVLLPLFLVGACLLGQAGAASRRTALIGSLALANLFVPFVHVTFTKLSPVNAIPWEILRLLKAR